MAKKTPLDLVIFDTCTRPEYYDDVHKVLALPRNHLITYDYSEENVSEGAAKALADWDSKKQEARVVLAYAQDRIYTKGKGSSGKAPLPEDAFVTLTRVAQLVDVRVVQNDQRRRYYLDIKLLAYPADLDQAFSRRMFAALRAKGDIPMETYIALYNDTAVDGLFGDATSDERSFSAVVEAMSREPSQFANDTFWRITCVTSKTKSTIPLRSVTKEIDKPAVRRQKKGARSASFISAPDKSTIYLDLQFHARKGDDTTDYRGRRITIEALPKSSSSSVLSTFRSRAFGQEVVAFEVPATSSFSTQEMRYQISTENHEQDECRDYRYGPHITVPIVYRKSLLQGILAIAFLISASVLFAWAAFATSTASAELVSGQTIPLWQRAVAVGLGVLSTLYAYYLWSDDIALDKARRG